MPDGPLEALNARCGTCDGISEVTWCDSWDSWLCASCRIIRSEAELRTTLAAKSVMQAAAGEAGHAA